RGSAIAACPHTNGGMASIGAAAPVVNSMLVGEPVVISGYNSARQTIISGELAAVTAVVAKARVHGLDATPLRVSHAFHSPLVADAAAALARYLEPKSFAALERPVASTITGDLLPTGVDLKALLERQISSPVQLLDAVDSARGLADLWIEVGPGAVLAGIIA